MNTPTDTGKKKNGTRRFPSIRQITIFVILALILFVGAKSAFELVFPFEFEPSVSIDFQQQDNQFLEKLHIEDKCYPAFNGEVQCYMRQNVSIGTRGLVLKAEYLGPDENGEPLITSGRVDTRNFFHPSCGRYEVVASFPSGTGVFAAIWLREPDWTQPDPSLINPAINIVEYQGGLTNFAHFNLHTNLTLSREDSKSNSKSVELTDLPDQFHTFGLEWTSRSIQYFVDGQKYHTIENQGDDWIHGPAELILNLAMGGNWAEDIASRQNLETWRGVQLSDVGQKWEVVIKNLRYYPLRNPKSC